MDTKDEVSFLIEEWKKNVDLHIHHDNLKQQRLRHFISIQALLFAVFGLAIREYADKASLLIVLLTALAPAWQSFFAVRASHSTGGRKTTQR